MCGVLCPVVGGKMVVRNEQSKPQRASLCSHCAWPEGQAWNMSLPGFDVMARRTSD
jgi:hypothetical protein